MCISKTLETMQMCIEHARLVEACVQGLLINHHSIVTEHMEVLCHHAHVQKKSERDRSHIRNSWSCLQQLSGLLPKLSNLTLSNTGDTLYPQPKDCFIISEQFRIESSCFLTFLYIIILHGKIILSHLLDAAMATINVRVIFLSILYR